MNKLIEEMKKNPQAYAKIIQDLDQKSNGRYTKLALFPVHAEVFRVLVQRDPQVYPDGPAPRAAGGVVAARG